MIKRSVVLVGHATSVSLELEFWEILRDLARADGVSVASLIARIGTRPRDIVVLYFEQKGATVPLKLQKSLEIS